MLYGYKLSVSNRITTAVVAADTLDEYNKWCGENDSVYNGCLYNEVYTSNFMDILIDENHKGYKEPIKMFFHDTEDERNEFIKKHSINEVKTEQGRDHNIEMVSRAKYNAEEEQQKEMDEKWKKRQEEIDDITKRFYDDVKSRLDAGEDIPAEQRHIIIENEYSGKTIGEVYGLNTYDPWDRRSVEDIEADEEVKKKIEQAKKMGILSGESFGKPKIIQASKGNTDTSNEPAEKESGKIYVREIEVDHDTSGKIVVKGISASIFDSEIDEEEKKKREEAEIKEKEELAKKVAKLKPRDFAKALRGDGRWDSTGGAPIEGDKPIIKKKKAIRKIKIDINNQSEEEKSDSVKTEEKNSDKLKTS